MQEIPAAPALKCSGLFILQVLFHSLVTESDSNFCFFCFILVLKSVPIVTGVLNYWENHLLIALP